MTRDETPRDPLLYADVDEYPMPTTEKGMDLSRRLRRHGLDFDRSIYNVEVNAARLASSSTQDALDEPPCGAGASCCHACETCGRLGCRYDEWVAARGQQ